MDYREKIALILKYLPEQDVCFIYHYLCEFYGISVDKSCI